MKKFFLLLILSSCSPDISKYYQEGFNKTKREKTEKVIYIKFAPALDDYYINQAYFDVEQIKIEQNLIEKGQATILTETIFSKYLTKEEVEKFANKIGAKVAVCYIFPKKKSVEHFMNKMSSWNDLDDVPVSAVTKLMFYNSK